MVKTLPGTTYRNSKCRIWKEESTTDLQTAKNKYKTLEDSFKMPPRKSYFKTFPIIEIKHTGKLETCQS